MRFLARCDIEKVHRLGECAQIQVRRAERETDISFGEPIRTLERRVREKLLDVRLKEGRRHA